MPELGDRVIVLNGVAKTYAMTGWRVGWLIGPTDVVKAATNLQSHATSNVSNVAQAAALAAVSGDLSAVAEMRAAFDRRRRTIVSMLNDIPGVVCPEPEGAFYAYPSVRGLLGRPLRGRTASSSVELAEIILDEVEVAVVPGEAFGTPGYAAAVLRPRRRRPGRGHRPDRQARRRRLTAASGQRAGLLQHLHGGRQVGSAAAARSLGLAMRQALAAT